jgi:hypothetical protein
MQANNSLIKNQVATKNEHFWKRPNEDKIKIKTKMATTDVRNIPTTARVPCSLPWQPKIKFKLK